MDKRSMDGLSTEAKMIIASNLAIAAFVRDAAILIKDGAHAADSKESVTPVTQVFSDILRDLEKQSLDRGDAGK